MKIKIYFLIVGIAILLNGCKEDPPCDCTPQRGKIQGDTEYVATTLATPQSHNVLLEDITGIRCQNCPGAHDIAASLNTNNPGRIVILALHAYTNNSLTAPLPGYTDFRDSAAHYIVTALLDNPGQLPAGGIDRKKFPLEQYRWVTPDKWSGFVNQDLPLATPVNIEITNAYDANTRELTTSVRMEFTDSVKTDAYLNVGISESHIIAWQKDNSGTITNYEHNHILREMLSGNNGLKINSSTIKLNPKQVVVRVYKYTLPSGWKAENCTVVAFVNNTNIDVLHAAEKKIM